MITNRLFYALSTISILTYAYGLFAYAPSLNHDDSLFFTQGIKNFSVIEFSPHFPGYPTFMVALKILNLGINDAAMSLHLLNILSILSSVFIASLIIKHYTNALFAFLTLLTLILSPMNFYAALSMMSDGFGLALFLSAYFAMIQAFSKSAGILSALALWARPSYLVLIGSFLLVKRLKKELFIPFLMLCSAILALLLFVEGSSYVHEAVRFTQGHFSVWGKGEFAQFKTLQWNEVLFEEIGLIPCILFGTSALFLGVKKHPLSAIFMAYLLWVLMAQNPNSIRHLLPLYTMGSMLLCIALFQLKARYLTWVSLILLIISSSLLKEDFSVKEAPLMQVAKSLPKNSVIITNYGVQTLKKEGFIVLDKFYYARVKAYIDSNPHKTYIEVTTQSETLFNEFKYNKKFKGRGSLEKPLYTFIKEAK